jgi:hypothetical protein
MAYGIVLEFDNTVGKKQYDAVNQKLGIDMAGGTGPWPEGLRSHAGGTTPTGFVVFEVWDSKAQHAAWMSGRLGEALGAVGVPAPTRVTDVEITGFVAP